MFSVGLIHHLPGPKSMVSFICFERETRAEAGSCDLLWCERRWEPKAPHIPRPTIALLCTQSDLGTHQPSLLGTDTVTNRDAQFWK